MTKIIRDYESEIYNEKNRLLGNCYTVIDNNSKYYFEFEVNKNQAKIIKSDKMSIILDVINEFRKYDKYVNVFYNEDNSFYKAFDEIFTFKLPIKIIQPSKFFINKDRLECIEKYLENEEIYIPVTIINDEYVVIDGHTRLYAKALEDFKMVNVYMNEHEPIVDDLVYMAKENNINNILKCEVISNEDYNTYWNGFLKSLQE